VCKAKPMEFGIFKRGTYWAYQIISSSFLCYRMLENYWWSFSKCCCWYIKTRRSESFFEVLFEDAPESGTMDHDYEAVISK
ncbi:hypothetical protein GIB67_012423, partial [Kingdonia uniflora]